MFVRQDVLGFVVLVARSTQVVDLYVLAFLVFINVEVEAAVGDDFVSCGGYQGLGVDLFFELMASKFLGDDVVDFAFDFFNCLVVGGTCFELFEETGLVTALIKVIKVAGFRISLCVAFCQFLFRELPECLYLILGCSCSGVVGRKSDAEQAGLFQHAKRLSL